MTEFGAVIKKEDRYAHIDTRITWVDISEATLFSSTYMAGVALKALRDQGFNCRKVTIAPVKITRIVEETEE